jgi:hypothetical protein
MQPHGRNRATTLSPSSRHGGADLHGSPLTTRPRSRTSLPHPFETSHPHSWHNGSGEPSRSGGKRSRGSQASEILHHGHPDDLEALTEGVRRFGDPATAR